jgi:hypothetical protein
VGHEGGEAGKVSGYAVAPPAFREPVSREH